MLQTYFENIELTVQSLGFAAGLAMTILGGFGALSNVFALSPIELMMNGFMALFGMTMCMLEFKDRLMVDQYRIFIEREMHIMYTPYGRGSFYVLAGVMLLTKGGVLQSLTGLFCIGVGVLSAASAKQASDTLSKLLDEHYDEAKIVSKFKQFDKGRSGFLDPAELKAMCADMSSTLTDAQLEAVVFSLDKTRDGRVSREEFINWWKTNKDNKGILAGIMSMCGM